MKSMISLVAILTLSFFVVPHEAQSKTLMVNKEATLEYLNKNRMEYAKKKRISNMHKLIWDENLAVRAQMKDFNQDMMSMRSARIDSAGDEYTDRVINWFINDFEAAVQEYMEKFKKNRVLGVEELVPHQKRVGCAPSFYSQQNRVITHTLCMFEPESTGESFLVPKGDPGSKCTNGYKNEDGLCSLPEKKPEAAPLVNATVQSVEASTTVEDGVNSYNALYLSSMVIVIAWFL